MSALLGELLGEQWGEGCEKAEQYGEERVWGEQARVAPQSAMVLPLFFPVPLVSSGIVPLLQAWLWIVLSGRIVSFGGGVSERSEGACTFKEAGLPGDSFNSGEQTSGGHDPGSGRCPSTRCIRPGARTASPTQGSDPAWRAGCWDATHCCSRLSRRCLLAPHHCSSPPDPPLAQIPA